MTTTRALAVAAYAAAVSSPARADWRAIADQLHSALIPARPVPADSAAPRWWADWKLGKVYSLDSLAVRFADGVQVRCNLARAPGKLPRIAASCRVAVAFYRARTGRDAVPAFASLEALSDGATFDPETCSRLTADLRRTGQVPAAVRPPVTPEAVARMTAEVERRRAGLERVLRRDTGLEGDAKVWRESLAAGEAELARMVGDASAPGPVFRPRVRPLHVEDADPAAGWCAAVTPSYGQPAAYAVAETWEPGAELPPLPVVGILGSVPVVEIGSDTPSATGSEFEADLSTDADPTYPLCSDDDDGRGLEPDGSSHPVIALCHSDKARAALFERIQDGTFPAADRTAKGGAWRLTLADAQDCAGIGSLRFVGLPRKPYTRRPAPPVEAIRTPLGAIRIPVALVSVGAPPAPVVYHAAPQL